MTSTKKSIGTILFAVLIIVSTSCARKTGTGCPSFGKVNKIETTKKSV